MSAFPRRCEGRSLYQLTSRLWRYSRPARRRSAKSVAEATAKLTLSGPGTAVSRHPETPDDSSTACPDTARISLAQTVKRKTHRVAGHERPLRDPVLWRFSHHWLRLPEHLGYKLRALRSIRQNRPAQLARVASSGTPVQTNLFMDERVQINRGDSEHKF